PHELVPSDQAPAVRQPVRRPAEPGRPGRDDFTRAVEADRHELLHVPMGEPQPVLVPARRLDESESVEQDSGVQRRLRCHFGSFHPSALRLELDRPVPSDGVTAANSSVGTDRSGRKRRAIMDAATTLFLRQGYPGTSMDQIAARAGVSKQTVYKHFADKERLFVEIVVAIVDE